MGRRIVALVSDAFGGRGGIATYNRHFLKAVCQYPGVDEVVVLPRAITYELEARPDNLLFETGAAGGKLRYAAAVVALAARLDGAALIICGHLHLLPFAVFLGLRFRCAVLPVIYGREAWNPSNYRIVNRLCRRIESFIAIRRLTADRFKNWAEIKNAHCYYLPNCVDAGSFGVAPKRADLCAKFGLANRPVIMTAGRIDEYERNKGFDEVLETLPLLLKDVPEVMYLIMGDGNDRQRLQEKAKALGVADRVAFTGYVPEPEKADYYRLADVVAMPGSDPGFDRYPFRFAFLEPLACGVPVVGAKLEDASERDDEDARQLVVQVNPNDHADIKRGILEAIAKRGQRIEPALSKFTYEAFRQNTHGILADVMDRGRIPEGIDIRLAR